MAKVSFFGKQKRCGKKTKFIFSFEITVTEYFTTKGETLEKSFSLRKSYQHYVKYVEFGNDCWLHLLHTCTIDQASRFAEFSLKQSQYYVAESNGNDKM